MRPLLITLLIALLALTACETPRTPGKSQCFQDHEGLTWTNERLMDSYEHRRDQIHGGNLCYPSIGLTEGSINNNQKCAHPRQELQPDGRCLCRPFPDVLFTPEEIQRWCNSVR